MNTQLERKNARVALVLSAIRRSGTKPIHVDTLALLVDLNERTVREYVTELKRQKLVASVPGTGCVYALDVVGTLEAAPEVMTPFRQFQMQNEALDKLFAGLDGYLFKSKAGGECIWRDRRRSAVKRMEQDQHGFIYHGDSKKLWMPLFEAMERKAHALS